jgi:hypothetical protein
MSRFARAAFTGAALATVMASPTAAEIARPTLFDNPFGSYSCGRMGRYDDFFGFHLDAASRSGMHRALVLLRGGGSVSARLTIAGRMAGQERDDVLFDAPLIMKRDGRDLVLSRNSDRMFRLRPPRPDESKPRTPGVVAADVDIVLERISSIELGADFPPGAAAICVVVQ